jgi:hypothetical protein
MSAGQLRLSVITIGSPMEDLWMVLYSFWEYNAELANRSGMALS